MKLYKRIETVSGILQLSPFARYQDVYFSEDVQHITVWEFELNFVHHCVKHVMLEVIALLIQ